MSSDRLIEVPRAEWPKLRDLYLSHKSSSYIAYMALDSYIRWLTTHPNIKHVKIYSLNGELSDGTFAIIDRYCAYVDAFNESMDNLRRLLRLLDFSKGLWFMTERSKVCPVIYEVIREKGLVIPENGVIPLLLFRLAKEKALQFDINPKPGIEVRPLDIHADLEKTSSAWPFKSSSTQPFFERMIRYSSTVGAYDESGKLLSWIFRYPTGPFASLYTDKDHLGQGLASLVTRQLCKTIAELGYDSLSGITATNTASLNLFQKLGFELFDEMSWISTTISWSEADE